MKSVWTTLSVHHQILMSVMPTFRPVPSMLPVRATAEAHMMISFVLHFLMHQNSTRQARANLISPCVSVKSISRQVYPFALLYMCITPSTTTTRITGGTWTLWICSSFMETFWSHPRKSVDPLSVKMALTFRFCPVDLLLIAGLMVSAFFTIYDLYLYM